MNTLRLKNTIKLSLRGLTRNKRRSLVTLLAIAFGFAAIILFAGYTHNIYDGLARGAIYGDLLGHLTVSKQGMYQEGKLDPERYMLTESEVQGLTKMLTGESHVKLVAPRLAFSGLISNGKASTIFIAEGIEPSAMPVLQEKLLTPKERAIGLYRDYEKTLDPHHPEVAELSSGLVDLLHLKPSGQAALLVNTLSGQANAQDITVGHVFNTGNAGSNDKFAFVALSKARSLLDAEGRADRLTILLDDTSETEAARKRMAKKFEAAGLDMEIKTWEDLSDFYKQVHGMFDMIFGFIFSIVLTVVVMSVANSMGMTVVERTREIGTLRAIGLRRTGVVRLFAMESLLLSLFGCIAGLLIALAVRWGINVAQISYIPPNSSNPVPLLVDIDVPRMVFTFVLMSLVGTMAAYLPARRAAKSDIIDALGHV